MIHEISTIVIIAYFLMFSQALAVFGVGLLVGCPKNWLGGLFCCGLLPNISDLSIAYLQTLETSNVFDDVDLGVSFVIIYMGLQMFLQFTMGSYKFIEYDFARDIKMEALKNKNESKEENFTTIQPSSMTSEESRHSSNPIVSANTDQIFDDKSIQTESIQTETSNSLNHSDFHRFIPSSSSRGNEPQSPNSNIRTSLPIAILGEPDPNTHPETVMDIVRVYSHANTVLDLENSMPLDDKRFSMIKFFKRIDWKGGFWIMIDIWKDSFRQPVSIVLVISVAIAMIPWVQALFVHSTQVQLPNAPDKQPPLSFIMDFAGYIGAAQVPFGLLLLGGTIGRLNIHNLPKKLWRLPFAITFVKLFIFPVIGCAFDAKIYRNGMFYGQDILYFVSNISFCLPPATSLLYITAFYTPNDGKDHIQMEILALVYIFHYICLVFCLPFTATYTMKVSLNF
ncbi:hypothetical protein CANINC_004302 [Pichia inconspicua]|uniref:Uncharacterized protein n=1 Tax=Pichia inconspicua TaxID=52247 RepID=A0A4T0WWE0_9ASCO|nr:hypothetical protein CANINC_004302 [[Candida] inconspicua]